MGSRILDAVEAVNDDQKRVLGAKIVKRFGPDLSGKRFAVWGLAFKPNTDDMREAPALELLRELLLRGASVTTYDPVAMHEAERILGDDPRIGYADNPMHAIEGAEALVIVTEWKEFRSPDFARLKQQLKTPAIFDGRNLYDPLMVRQLGFEYYPMGRPELGRGGATVPARQAV